MHIRAGTIDDIEQIVELANRIFGRNPKVEAQFKKWITSPDYNVSVATTRDDRVVGFASGHANSNLDPEKYLPYGQPVVDFLTNQKVGFLLTLATDSSFRKQGIGQALGGKLKAWLEDQNCTVLAGCSWVSGSVDNSLRIFEREGFEKLGESSDFMHQQSLTERMVCAVCGHPCRCAAIFYGLKTTRS
jgi:ribosomal protein S18 acetylase RimI-like enzyme